jgi:glucokinase
VTGAVAIGIDIGGTRLRTAVVAEDGTVLEQRRRPTPAGEADTLLAALEEEVTAVGGDLPVGIGIAGLVTPDGIVRYGPNIGVRDLSVAAGLEERVGRPVTVINDASAAALGEQRVGAGRGCDDLVLFTIGTGVGGGVVLDGRLLVGAGGFAGELGHLIVEEGGRPCPCGNHGCVEAYAAGSAIGRIATDHLVASDRPSVLRKLPTIDGPAVTRAAEEGDEIAREVLAEVGTWLGVGIASCVNALDPALVLIGGGAARAIAPYALPASREAAAARLLGRRFRTPPPIELAVLGDDAGTVGAALHATARHPATGGGQDGSR